jgi:hypothetical protein
LTVEQLKVEQLSMNSRVKNGHFRGDNKHDQSSSMYLLKADPSANVFHGVEISTDLNFPHFFMK